MNTDLNNLVSLFLTVMDPSNKSKGNIDPFIDAVDALSNEQRKELRTRLLDLGVKALPRNLFFNYQTQQWIE